MLALDIETMGLDRYRPSHALTMVCLYDGEKSLERSFPFLLCVNCETGAITDQDMFEDMKQEIVGYLDEAENIITYNGIEFDLPFLAEKLDIIDGKLGKWVMKTIDVFHTIKLLMGRMFKLDVMLKVNGLSSKEGSGLQAISWAREGNVQDLDRYCMMDTKLTYELTMLEQVLLPGQNRLAWSIEQGLYYKKK